MPLARIITDVADDCLELTMQLRARGFQVETVAPGFIPSVLADLEVRMEQCAPEDVVNYMAQSSAGDDLWVFVAPGALDSNFLPIRNVPISISSDIPRIGLRKADVESREMPHLVENSAGVSPLTMTAQRPNPKGQGNSDFLALLGALGIDAQNEDLILAELHEFPILSAPGRSAASVPTAHQPVEKAGVLTRLAAKVSEKSRKIEEQGGVEKRDVHESALSRPTPQEKTVATKWLAAPEKVMTAASDRMTIPIVPDPVRANIVLPVAKIARKIEAPRVWNLQRLKVACSVAALTISAWFLIGTSRLGNATKARTVEPATATSTQQSPPPTTPARSVDKAQSQSKTPSSASVATAVAPSKAMGASTVKLRPHHPADSDVIAPDTVTFYDRRPLNPRANGTQAESAVKRYSDHN